MPWDSAGQFFPSAVIRHCFQRDWAQRVLMESCKDGNHINQVLGLSQLQVSFCLWLWSVDKTKSSSVMEQSTRGCVITTLGFRQVVSADPAFAGSCLCTGRLVLPCSCSFVFLCVFCSFPSPQLSCSLTPGWPAWSCLWKETDFWGSKVVFRALAGSWNTTGFCLSPLTATDNLK